MKGFTAFMKKELLEAVRSYKLVILLIVFAALGFMNPVSARYLPELVAGFLPEGMHMEIPQPVVLDSWLQFFKNTAQIDQPDKYPHQYHSGYPPCRRTENPQRYSSRPHRKDW